MIGARLSNSCEDRFSRLNSTSIGPQGFAQAPPNDNVGLRGQYGLWNLSSVLCDCVVYEISLVYETKGFFSRRQKQGVRFGNISPDQVVQMSRNLL